jgi:hypothetical protein
VKSESLLRVDFPGRKSWGRVEEGAVWEGRLSLPLYAGEQIVAPAGSTIRVTVNSVEKIREDLGFWRKTGRAIVRAFNPLETSRPSEYHVELRASDLVLRVLRASSGVMGTAESEIIAGGRCRAREKQSLRDTPDRAAPGSVILCSGWPKPRASDG